MPTPALGLVVQYGFVWAAGPGRKPPDAGKDRPCLIAALERTVAAPAPDRLAIRVTYLPFSHVPPRAHEAAIKVPPSVARHLGLTAQESYLYVSYAVEDDWPFDLTHVPGSTSRFDYGFIPPRLFAQVAARFAAFQPFIHKP